MCSGVFLESFILVLFEHNRAKQCGWRLDMQEADRERMPCTDEELDAYMYQRLMDLQNEGGWESSTIRKDKSVLSWR